MKTKHPYSNLISVLKWQKVKQSLLAVPRTIIHPLWRDKLLIRRPINPNWSFLGRHFLSILFIPLLFSSIDSRACGLFLPNSYLIWGYEFKIGNLPVSDFYQEMRKIFVSELEQNHDSNSQPFHIYDWAKDGSHWDRTLAADVSDLQQFMINSNNPDGDHILKQYRTMRLSMQEKEFRPKRKYRYYRKQKPVQKLKIIDLSQYSSLLAELPSEFSLYVRGAAAYRSNKMESASKLFQELLKLPPEKRHFRSTWAAFMLGKVVFLKNPVEARAWFNYCRSLQQDGYQDSLDLSTSSLASLGKLEYDLENYTPSLTYYLELLPVDSFTSMTSINLICRQVFSYRDSTIEFDNAWIHNPKFRQVATAWIISTFYKSTKVTKRYLEAIENAELTEPIAGADRLAWLAYTFGKLDLATRWLSLADADSPHTLWVKSKLLLRQGDDDQALDILMQLAKIIPEDENWNNGKFHSVKSFLPRHEVFAELGLLLTSDGRYVEALDAFISANNSMDAAYIAELVLTTDELISYLNSRNDILSQKKYDWLSYLLARRLARQGTWNIARKYYPEDITDTFDIFVNRLTSGRDERLDISTRTSQLFAAGMLARQMGMELMGTEIAPDWFMYGGRLGLGNNIDERLTDKQRLGQFDPAFVKRTVLATPDEKQRVTMHSTDFKKRFHYRYYAAELMWETAQLLPDNDSLAALSLYRGGIFLKRRDPTAADRFYKALVNRCSELSIGQEAHKLRWFPKKFTSTRANSDDSKLH